MSYRHADYAEITIELYQCGVGLTVTDERAGATARQDARSAAGSTRRLSAAGRGIEPLVPWLIAAIASSGLYFGRSVLIPIILAVLLSFLLTPIVASLRRVKLPRPPAVLLAVALALGGTAITSAVIVSQAANRGSPDLAADQQR